MAIKNYIRPQLEVYQMLEVTKQETGDHLAACILGPTYDLYRQESDNVTPVVYNSAVGAEIDLPVDTFPTHHYELDTDSVELDAEDLVARVSVSEWSSFAVHSAGKVNQATLLVPDDVDSLTFQIKTFNRDEAGNVSLQYLRVPEGEGDKLTPKLNGRNIEVGDVLYIRQSDISDTNEEEGITDKEIAGDLSKYAAVITDVLPAIDSFEPEVSSDDTVGVDGGGHYTGGKSTTYILSYTKETDTISVSDTAGLEMAYSITGSVFRAALAAVGSTYKIGELGVYLVCKTANLGFADNSDSGAVKQELTISCLPDAESSSYYDRVRLDRLPMPVSDYKAVLDAVSSQEVSTESQYKGAKNAIGVPVSVAVCVSYTGPIPNAPSISGENWTVEPKTTDNGDVLGKVKLKGNMYISIATDFGLTGFISAMFISGCGTLIPTYRVLTYPIDSDEEMFTITTTEEIQEAFGTIDLKNPLAYGCQVALTAAAGREIYAIRTHGIDEAAFRSAVKKTEGDSNTYSFTPLTYDVDAIKAVTSFNQDMSQPDVKKWRRTVVGVESAKEYEVAVTDLKDNAITAYVVPRGTYGNVLVQLNPKVDLDLKHIPFAGTSTTLHEGDKVRFVATGAEYEVAGVISSRELVLKTGPSTEMEKPMVITLIKADSPENNIEYVSSYAGNFGNRRVTVVWTDKGVLSSDSGDYDVIPNMYIACEVAGLSSSVVPQQSITHTEIKSINVATRMYTQYTKKQLDKIAAGGVLIVTQDTKNDPIYIRHGLTTETDKGNLYYEDMCTRNIDNISYAVCDVLEPYIGRANVTPTALLAIKRDITSLLTRKMGIVPDEMVGPQLIEFDGLTVRQDETYLDCVNVNVNLHLPLPLNNIRVYEMAYVARVSIADTEAIEQ